jgi:hypothetical protein
MAKTKQVCRKSPNQGSGLERAIGQQQPPRVPNGQKAPREEHRPLATGNSAINHEKRVLSLEQQQQQAQSHNQYRRVLTPEERKRKSGN